MAIDHRIPAAQLSAQLSAAGFSLTWPPADSGGWRAIARCIARQKQLPPRPTVYDPAVLQAVHAANASLARAAMRTAAGWLQAPHGDRDFQNTLGSWAAGLCLDWDDGDQHFVAARCAAFGRGRDRVDVARCKDCGLPVYRTGGDHPGESDTMGWRPIWP